MLVVWPAPQLLPPPLPATSPHPRPKHHHNQEAVHRRWEVWRRDGEDGDVFYKERGDGDNDAIMSRNDDKGNMNEKMMNSDEKSENKNSKRGNVVNNMNRKVERRKMKQNINNSEDDDDYDLTKFMEDTGGQYNVTPPNAQLLVYNRIPKCASSTMQTVLRWCARWLGFEHVSSEVYDERQLKQEARRRFVQMLTAFNTASPSSPSALSSSSSSSSSSSFSYDRHLYYIDFVAEGAETHPVYINVVREPIERFISSFYYVRSKERLARIAAKGHLKVKPSSYWLNRTVEQCVMNGEAECSFVNGTKQETVITYFCGHQEFCKTVGSSEALQRAKQVVAERYSVVGLVGHMEMSLQLMQTLVPGFLKGALDFYFNIRKKKEKLNRNSHKPAVPREVRQELRRRMGNDIDFYNFLRQRLFLQAQTFLTK
ncbi:heparan sulfate 2-O-sulfotransferase hst-2-like isoform X2 [Portunus trituberculatus]|nr:heparan sulfate 2-O-sulfotransferase hst-2-like isoform X2 [Portunus trituberculatus]